ncbi:trihelix transcription factor ASR3-like [Phragmites australis]|uniref:trihelix transcription factor ASR3-like n=1 Tax=Phragmites australis TaxID=29695 RepID=UPI002D766D3B|nr:trihelix transcription factor ASR3-like [Phragmites australis]
MSNAGDPAGAAAAAAATPSGRAPRLPRWTRQEILVLIDGKRMADGRGGRGGRGRVAAAAATAASGEASTALEPKWAAVAEYCRRHGVERGPVQCRKRWSNLAGDYKKIKEWERTAPAAREPSFWAMRNDARRERRLPGFFDREVYDILEGRGRAILTGRSGANATEEEEAVHVEEEEEVGAVEPVFDSGRPATEEALFSEDEEEEEEEAPAPAPPPPPPPVIALPVSEKPDASRQQQSAEQGTSKDKEPEQSTERDAPAQQGRHKRLRTVEDTGEGTTDLQRKLIEILDRNNRMVAAQLEAQNRNCQLDREQRKDQANGLVLVLGKLADALGRIADKL